MAPVSSARGRGSVQTPTGVLTQALVCEESLGFSKGQNSPVIEVPGQVRPGARGRATPPVEEALQLPDLRGRRDDLLVPRDRHVCD